MPEREQSASEDASPAGFSQGPPQRLDKWLWYARVVKTRSLAAALVTRGRVRVNRERTQKPSHIVRPGDVITASVSRDVRVLKVLLPGSRRGPASEAQTLYEDLTPARLTGSPDAKAVSGANGDVSSVLHDGVLATGSGRPSKKERRQIVRLKGKGR